MEFQAETGAFGLVFMLFVFGLATLVLPAFAVQSARARSPWFPFAIGFFLVAVMVDVLSVTRLFDIALAHRDPFLIGLLIAGFGRCMTVWPLMMLARPFRPVTKIGFALLLVLLILVVAAGAVRVLDPIFLWIGGGLAPGPVASALDLAAWERPVFVLVASVALLAFTVVVTTTSVEPVHVEGEGGTDSGRSLRAHRPGCARLPRPSPRSSSASPPISPGRSRPACSRTGAARCAARGGRSPKGSADGRGLFRPRRTRTAA